MSKGEYTLSFTQAIVQMSKGRILECESDPWYQFRMEGNGEISVRYPDGWHPAIMADYRYTSKWRVKQ